MYLFTKSALVASIASLALWAGQAQAAPITSLFNTGVDASGTPLADNALDPHYVITSPAASTPFVATSAGGYPIGEWIGDNATSAWIAPTADTFDAAVTFVYRTSFDLTGFDPASALISGVWATDDPGTDILINGASTGNASCCFTGFTPFSITSGFVAGINTLDFFVFNSGGPTGLRVEMTGTADPVPEPVTLSLLGAGLAGVAGLRRRKA